MKCPLRQGTKPGSRVSWRMRNSPPAGSIDRIVPHDRPVHSDERHRGHRADERAVLHGDILRLIALGLRTEVGQARAPAEVDCPLPGMLEPAAADHHVLAAPLGLNTVIARRVAVPEGAADDLSPVTAHHVDSRATAAPSFDGAALDPEILHAGELDPVPVAGRSYVPDDHSSQQDVMGGHVERTAVVDVDAVASRPRHDQVMQFEVRDLREVEPGGLHP